MSDQEKEVLNVFERVLPNLSEVEKARLLGIGEGLALKSKPSDNDKED